MKESIAPGTIRHYGCSWYVIIRHQRGPKGGRQLVVRWNPYFICLRDNPAPPLPIEEIEVEWRYLGWTSEFIFTGINLNREDFIA